MRASTKQTAFLGGLFASFMFLQLTVLGLGNRAGTGYLPAQQREWVYYVIQVFVILGFLSYAAVRRLIHRRSFCRGVTIGALAAFFAGATILLTAKGSLFQVAVTFATVFFLGYLGGTVYERMSLATASGVKSAVSMGAGCAAAIALQFVLQFQWGVTPLLPVFMLGAFGLLTFLLLRGPEPAAAMNTAIKPERVPAGRLGFTCLIAAVLLLFTAFYNGYIHHLQVNSGYTDYNVYTWPRLMLIPGYLFFAVIGNRKQGRLVPMAALCITLIALLNTALVGSAGTYRLNMCLFYIALSGAVSYYNLSFWRLAQGTKHPVLWASMGRMLDSAVVLLTGVLHLPSLPAAAVLAIDIGGLIAVILLFASGIQRTGPIPVLAVVGDGFPSEAIPTEDVFSVLQARYNLTQRETEVLRELVLTEDKQTVISERLSIKVNTLQGYVTRIYRKTGTTTRAGLTDLYHYTLRER